MFLKTEIKCIACNKIIGSGEIFQVRQGYCLCQEHGNKYDEGKLIILEGNLEKNGDMKYCIQDCNNCHEFCGI